MKKIKNNNGDVLHIIYRLAELEDLDFREDISDESEFLQLAAIKIPDNHKFRGHKHLTLPRETNITQECWVVVKGKVKTFHYDESDNLLEENILEVFLSLKGLNFIFHKFCSTHFLLVVIFFCSIYFNLIFIFSF